MVQIPKPIIHKIKSLTYREIKKTQATRSNLPMKLSTHAKKKKKKKRDRPVNFLLEDKGQNLLLEAAYSYRISEPNDQGNNSRINHELKLLINNHKNYVHLEHYTQTHQKIKKRVS